MVSRMPGSRSERFVKPSAGELAAFRDVLGRIASYDLPGAEQALFASGLPYRLVRLADSGAEGREVIVLEESGTVPKGWGTFVVDPAPRSALVLEVPHVGYDIDTETEGVDVFRHTRARALLVAGAHRCANAEATPCSGQTDVCGGPRYKVSDAAHFTGALFQAAHEELSSRWPGTLSVSLHGHSDASCEDVFLSSGVAGDPGPVVPLLLRALLASGALTAGAAGVPGSSCDLVGSTNVQGRASNGSPSPCTAAATAASGRFVHAEQSRRVRGDARLRKVVADALLEVAPRLSPPPVAQPGAPVPAERRRGSGSSR